MKIAKMIITALALTTVSFGAISAELLTKEALKEHPEMYTKVGTIVTDGEMAPSDAKEELAKKADEKGGDFFVVTSTDTDRKIHATADVYKKK